MGKRFLLFVAVFSMVFAGAAFVSAQETAKTSAVTAKAPVAAANGAKMTRTGHPRVGFGFNGIPLDGSHLEALRLRRSYRNSR